MKRNIEQREIISSGTSETVGFKIKASAQAFKVLSDGLYSDKPEAIVRELSSNAHDAHVDAGNANKPFLVHLPNSIEPWFSIRDYGIGLCHEDVLHLYTTFFESTKTESNDVTGMLGLGSKAPFSYVDSFTVTSYFNGEMRVYQAVLNEHGCPDINVIDGFPVPTDEHNGLKIEMPVNKSDFHRFVYAAKKVYRYYDVQPTVKGVADFKPTPVEVVMSGNGWRLVHDRGIRAIQGTVAYPINFNSVDGLDTPGVQNIHQVNMDLIFPIGDLDIAASREALSYDQKTQENIVKRLKDAQEEIRQQIEDQITICKSPWQASCQLSEILSNSSVTGLTHLFNRKLDFIQYKNKPIDTQYNINLTEDCGITINWYTEGSRSQTRTMRHIKYKEHVHRSENVVRIKADKSTHIFVNDLKTGAQSRVRHWAKENSVRVYDNIYVFNHEDVAKAEDFIKTNLGLYKHDIQYTSKLPKAPTQSRPKASPLPLGYYINVRHEHVYNQRDRFPNLTEIDFNEELHFVYVHDRNIEDERAPNLHVDNIYRFLRHWQKTFVDKDKQDKTIKLIGVPRSQRKKFDTYIKENNIKIHDIVKIAQDKIRPHFKKHRKIYEMGIYLSHNYIRLSYFDAMRKIINQVSAEFPKVKVLSEYSKIMDVNAAGQNHFESSKFYSLATVVQYADSELHKTIQDITSNSEDSNVHVDQTISEFKRHYGVLEWMDEPSTYRVENHRRFVEDVTSYVRQITKQLT